MELEAVGVFESNAQQNEEMNKVSTKEVRAAARHCSPGVSLVVTMTTFKLHPPLRRLDIQTPFSKFSRVAVKVIEARSSGYSCRLGPCRSRSWVEVRSFDTAPAL
jgi:hypothetical protein